MSIEAGARAGLVSPDVTTVEFLKGRRYVNNEKFSELEAEWLALATDEGATYDKVYTIDASEIEPFVTWGTNPAMGSGISKAVPKPTDYADESDQLAISQALDYMGFAGGEALEEVSIQHVFIGSCTNARLSDLKEAAEVIRGKQVAQGVRALVVPGSQTTKKQAEELGLDQVFINAGFEWRESGCSMCLAMNDDVVPAGERCASTSNRNFEGRQGTGARTHLMSPAMAAAAAIEGKLTDVRNFRAVGV